jgi:hypothetical protein
MRFRPFFISHAPANGFNGGVLPIASRSIFGKRRFELLKSFISLSQRFQKFPVSGYHMAVVVGVVFFAVRALLALIPGLTVGFPIRKCRSN